MQKWHISRQVSYLLRDFWLSLLIIWLAFHLETVLPPRYSPGHNLFCQVLVFKEVFLAKTFFYGFRLLPII